MPFINIIDRLPLGFRSKNSFVFKIVKGIENGRKNHLTTCGCARKLVEPLFCARELPVLTGASPNLFHHKTMMKLNK